jgi:hypothetical protein
MGKPDALSRQADHGSGQGDNDNLMLLAPELFWIHALAGVRLEGDERNIRREVGHSLKDDVQEELVAKAARCKGNLTDLRRSLHSSLAKGNPKRTL